MRIAVGGDHRGGTDKTADEVGGDDDIVGVIAAGAVPDDDVAGAVHFETAIGKQAVVPFDPVITSGRVDVVPGEAAIVIAVIVHNGAVGSNLDALAGIEIDRAIFDRGIYGENPGTKII